MRVLIFLLEKEFKQMFRSKVLPVLFVAVTIFMINAVPRIANQQPKHMSVTVIDHDKSSTSRRLVEKITATDNFRLSHDASSMSEALAYMDKEGTDFIIEIPANTEKTLMRERHAEISILSNAVNGMKAGLGTSYITKIVADFNNEINADLGIALKSQGEIVHPRYMFNPTLDYKPYMVPGIIALLLTLFVGFLPALNIISEKEKGTMEQINVTPVGRLTFILSKLIPYWVVGLAMLTLSLIMARLIFGIKPSGQLLSIYLLATIFIVVVSSLGLVISNYSATSRQAGLVMFFFLVIFILTSGLITPVDSMPGRAQIVTMVNPMRHFIGGLRAVSLRGSTLSEIPLEVVSLIVLGLLASVWAVLSYRKQQ